jgi:hypothetical protein
MPPFSIMRRKTSSGLPTSLGACGDLRFDADYIRGRRVKTRIVVRSNGIVTLETIGRGKAALRWLEQLRGKKLMQLVGQ